MRTKHTLSVSLLCVLTPLLAATAAPISGTAAELQARDALGAQLPGARVLWERNDRILHSHIAPWSEQQVSAGSTVERRPRWSPDGTRFVFCRQNSDNWDVYVRNADFTGEQRIVQGAHTADWCQAGAAITAIVHDVGRSDEEGCAVVRYTFASEVIDTIYDARWNWANGWCLAQAAELHPDGRYLLAFTRDDNHNTLVVDLSQRTVIMNTQMDRGDCNPGWAPDGTWFTNTARTSSRPVLKVPFSFSGASVQPSVHLCGMDTSYQYYVHGHRVTSDGDWVIGGLIWNAGPLSGNRELYVWDLNDPNRDDHCVRLTYDDQVDQRPSLFIGTPSTEPTLALAPSSLTFTASVGGAAPAAQTVTITNAGGGTLAAATAVENSSWLSVSAAGSDNSQQVTATVNITGLPIGTHRDTITVTCSNATNSPRRVPVTLDISGTRQADDTTGMGLVSGMNVEYYALTAPASVPDFSTLSRTGYDSIATVNYPADTGEMLTSGLMDNVGIVFSGYIYVNRDDDYTFFVECDDGALLYVGGILVVDNNGTHAMTEEQGTLTLQEGFHPLRIEYYEGTGSGGIILRWQRTGGSKHITSEESFYRAPLPVPYVRLLSPTGGETWQAGTVQYIDFEAAHITQMAIAYSLNNGEDFEEDIWTVDEGAPQWGHFAWTVPDVSSDQVIISVSPYNGESAPAFSDPITIVGSAVNAPIRATNSALPAPSMVRGLLRAYVPAEGEVAVYRLDGTLIAQSPAGGVGVWHLNGITPGTCLVTTRGTNRPTPTRVTVTP